MPKLSPTAVPSYCRHKATGRAYVDFGQGEVYLGAYGSKESRAEYNRLIAEWLANGRRPLTPKDQVTIAEVMHAFIQWAKTHYRRPDGSTTGELDNFKDALRPLKRLYALTRAVDFGPLSLMALRDEMVKLGWCRSHVNRQVGRVRFMFKWATSRELIPVAIHQALCTVEGLKVGRTAARESKPVKPVADAAVEATLPFLSRQVQALVKLQRLTGCRPGEACSMRRADLTTTGELWEYHPASHKTAHHGHERVIVLGKQARAIVEEFLTLDPNAHLFRPADAEADRRAKMAEAREQDGTPLSCGNVPGSNRRRRPKRQPGDRYTVKVYAGAIAKACDRAFPPPERLARQRVPAHGRKVKATRWETVAEWKTRLGEKLWKELRAWRRAHRWHPNQLRHAAATDFRKRFGLEVAQVLLGHKTLTVTQVYAEKNVEAARQVMAQVG